MPIFNLSIRGSSTVGLESWVDLGLIPITQKIWIGSASYTSISKAITFSLRTNNAGYGDGTALRTTVLATAAPKVGATISQDLYKNGRMLVRSVLGTGVEHWWMYLKSKSATAGNYLYVVNYVLY